MLVSTISLNKSIHYLTSNAAFWSQNNQCLTKKKLVHMCMGVFHWWWKKEMIVEIPLLHLNIIPASKNAYVASHKASPLQSNLIKNFPAMKRSVPLVFSKLKVELFCARSHTWLTKRVTLNSTPSIQTSSSSSKGSNGSDWGDNKPKQSQTYKIFFTCDFIIALREWEREGWGSRSNSECFLY